MTLKAQLRKYPRQFWLMFFGLIFSTTGTTMIWPFLMIFVSERLTLPLTAVASLMTVNAIAGLTSSILSGPIVDRYGRKWVMVIGLIGNALAYLLYANASQYWHFALLMALSGFFQPSYRIGTDAMLADMFTPEERADAYALIRMGRNVGVALGPALGGFVLSRSYTYGLYGAAFALAMYGLFVLLFIHETYTPTLDKAAERLKTQVRGYLQALQDKLFMHLVGAFALVELCAAMVWVMLSVYLKTGFGIPESRYAWLPTTNALMVVLFQVLVTRFTRKHKPTRVMAFGAGFYTLAMVVIAASGSYWGFWAAMVIMTIGELAVVPTATAFAANLAPADKRGRYMSLYGLTWHFATGISPLLAGVLSDNLSPRSPWIVGAVIGVISITAFLSLRKRETSSQIVG